MDFSIKPVAAKTGFTTFKTGCIAVAVFENKILSTAAQALDTKGEILAALKSGDLTGKPGYRAKEFDPAQNFGVEIAP